MSRKYSGEKPKRVDGQMTSRTAYYREELTKLVKGLFEIKCPDNWDIDYILNTLINMGYIIVTDTDFGVLPLRGSLTGYNYFNNPTGALITVPLIPQLHRTIGEDCEILYLERTVLRTYYTFYKKISIYAEKLASADAAIDVNLMNSKLAYIAEAETKAQAESIKAMYDEISDGNPLVVYRKEATLSQTGLQVFFGNVKQNFVADIVQDSKRTIVNEFLTSIGINNSNTDKRERLITDEVNANNEELEANTTIWKQNLESCTKKINAMFPEINFSIKLKFDASNRKVDTSDTDRQRGTVENDA